MLKINPEVLKAVRENRPVVALESTIISHGMPYPKNVETALAVEKVIRDHGAIPATIGIINGDAIVGMTPEEIELFGKTKGILKASRRDLPVVYAKKLKLESNSLLQVVSAVFIGAPKRQWISLLTYKN